jgi:uncharacterized membrane-anchored protein
MFGNNDLYLSMNQITRPWLLWSWPTHNAIALIVPVFWYSFLAEVWHEERVDNFKKFVIVLCVLVPMVVLVFQQLLPLSLEF